MKKRLTNEKRAALENKFKQLKQVQAYFEAGKAENIVDGVSPEDASIKNVVEKLMSLMDAQDGAGKYKVASKKKLEALVRLAFDEESPAPEAPMHKPETTMDEAHDLENPVLHPLEDLEHEVQTMDDSSLMAEVEQLEDDLKDKLFSHSPKAAPHDSEAPTMEAHTMTPEQKMALLMNMPKNQRLQKAANLRAFANALEMAEHEVSNNNFINNTEKSDKALANDYEGEEEGSMKDTGTKQAALKLKASLRELITASEEVADEKEDKDEKDMEKEAVLHLALRHLLASVEEAEDEDMEKEASDEMPWDKKESEEEDDEDKEDEEPSMDERRAILKARLASLRKSKASVDGRTMPTPKEVPNPSGTTEDQLKGDAKIQYSTALGEDGLEEIHERRQKVPSDKPMAGTEEPNELYMANKPVPENQKMTSEKDSAKDINNKRVLKDEGTAVFNPQPTSPTDHMEMGAGSHQKTKDWEKAKSESDMTPGGDRLKGLAELVQLRTERAMKLASKMASRGLLKTEAQLQEQVVKLATMEDEVFEKVAEYFESTVLNKKAEFPESFRAREGDPEDKKPPFDNSKDDDDMEDEEDDKPAFLDKKEARVRRKASRDEDNHGQEIRRVASQESRGVTRALNLVGGGDDIISARGSAISNKLNAIAWSDAVSKAEELGNLDTFYRGGPIPGLV